MKNIRFILIITLLLAFAPYIKGQETQQMIVVHGKDNVLYHNSLTASDSITFSKFTVTGSAGVLINGVVWATCNVDAPGAFASSPTESGMFYQWNRKVGWSSTDPLVNHLGGTTWDSSMPTGNSWEKANDPCPTGWRVPTREEEQSLVNSGSFWGELNGVHGRFFGTGSQRVFFPAAGGRDGSDGSLYLVGSTGGGYWSSTPFGSEGAYYLHFGGGAYASICDRTYGFSVRCVSE